MYDFSASKILYIFISLVVFRIQSRKSLISVFLVVGVFLFEESQILFSTMEFLQDKDAKNDMCFDFNDIQTSSGP